MTIRFVASDLDGTVLRADLTVSTRTVEAVARLEDAGIAFAICTARAPRSTIPIAHDLGVRHGFAICNSGGTIVDLETEAVVHRHVFDPQLARELVSRLRARVPEIAFSGFVHDDWHREPHYSIPPLLDDAQRVEERIGDALEFLADGVTKMSVRHSQLEVDELHRHVADAAIELGLTYALSSAGFVEVLGPGIDKAAGVAWVAERLGLGAADTIAFGDDRPDIPMLVWAGRGVAVGNAHPEVLAVADEVCGSVDDNGVAAILEQLG